MKLYITRRELRKQFEKQTEIPLYNSQGEIDLDYILWLENHIIEQTIKEQVEENNSHLDKSFKRIVPLVCFSCKCNVIVLYAC